MFADLPICTSHIILVQNVILALIANVGENALHKFHSARVARHLASVFLPMGKGHRCVIAIACVNASRGKLIARALNGVLIRHQGDLLAVLIVPIFYVMLVSSLMVKPSIAVPLFSAANADRGACSGEVFDALKKFGRREFRKIVHESAENKTALGAIYQNSVLMSEYQSGVKKNVLKFEITHTSS